MAQLYSLDDRNPIVKKFMALDAELAKKVMSKAAEGRKIAAV
jgi:hypothetical protein